MAKGYRRRLEEFFNHFSRAHAQSLQQSREVLQEREQLEITLQDLQSQIRARLAKISELQQERQLLQDSNADVNAYKHFTYQVEVIKHRKVDLPAGQSATICLQYVTTLVTTPVNATKMGKSLNAQQ